MREPERKRTGIMISMSSKLECLQERSQFDLVCVRRGESQILLDCAPLAEAAAPETPSQA
jgi:hypothetical protein